MDPPRTYRRVVLKLSGDAFCAGDGGAIDEEQTAYIAEELKEGRQVCPELSVVVGAGNIMRGARFRRSGPGRILADHCGMLGTVINALVLKERLGSLSVDCKVFSAVGAVQAVEPFTVERCLEVLQQGRLVILAGGTGNPLFTTDTAAVLRAVELGAEIVMKATRVDGVYSADPEQQETARLLTDLSFAEVIDRKLGVMDLTAASLCYEHNLPARVFNYRAKGNIGRALSGEQVGTFIRSS